MNQFREARLRNAAQKAAAACDKSLEEGWAISFNGIRFGHTSDSNETVGLGQVQSAWSVCFRLDGPDEIISEPEVVGFLVPDSDEVVEIVEERLKELGPMVFVLIQERKSVDRNDQDKYDLETKSEE